MRLVDPHGRRMRKLRVQLTDACNYRCFYCMPEGTRFLPPSDLLAPEEIEGICTALHSLGVEEVRVTGGEPTVRPEFEDILARLARIPWRRLGFTTNGHLLTPKLPFLRDIGVRGINVSMDSLREEAFKVITGRGDLGRVLSAVRAARDSGFEVKVNAIIFRGLNDAEVPDFASFAEQEGVEVRFLELMKVGPAAGAYRERFVSADEILSMLEVHGGLEPVTVADDSTARVYRTAKGGRLGIIASETQPFCGSCSRLRLSATGRLRSCLFSDTGVSLRGRDVLDYPEILHEVMAMKPVGRLPRIAQPMNQIGG